MQNNLQLCYSAILNVESHCSLIVKQNINILLSFNCTSTVAQLFFNSSLSHRSLSSPLSLSLSLSLSLLNFFYYSLSVLILSFNPSPSLVPLLVFGCGVEIVVDFRKMGKKFMGFVWVWFCWVLLVIGDCRCLGPILLGFCWSFVGFVLAVVVDGSEAFLV